MEELQGVPWGIITPIFIIQFILLVVALIDLAKIHQTNGPKWIWVLVIVFISIFGPITYFIAGRKQA